MSALGTLNSGFPSVALSSRLAPVADPMQAPGRGNEGNDFLSMIAREPADGSGKASIRSAISPELAYRATLVGSMLLNADGQALVAGIGETVDGGGELSQLDGELVAGSSEGGSGEGQSGEDVTNGLQSSDTQGNDLPLGDENVYSPIGRPTVTDLTDDSFTNQLPKA